MPEYPVDLFPASPKKMVYFMEVYVDGGCRRNGRPDSTGAAAAVFKNRRGRHKTWIRYLPPYPPATNQRAEITAIIVALEQILEKYDELFFLPPLEGEAILGLQIRHRMHDRMDLQLDPEWLEKCGWLSGCES
jgi:hypothetical protein